MSAPDDWTARMRCCLIAERAQCRGDLFSTVEAALAAGLGAVQLREKTATTRELYELAGALRDLTHRHNALLLINDRVDIALAVGADGVHLGWQSLGLADVRRLCEAHLRGASLGAGEPACPGAAADRRTVLVGRSVHNMEEAREAVAVGADYLFAGPVFDTPSKAGLVPTLGIDGLRAICAAFDRPVFGLGGIDADNAASVIEAGARGVAVIRAVLSAADPAAAASQLLAATSV